MQQLPVNSKTIKSTSVTETKDSFRTQSFKLFCNFLGAQTEQLALDDEDVNDLETEGIHEAQPEMRELRIACWLQDYTSTEGQRKHSPRPAQVHKEAAATYKHYFMMTSAANRC